jgi:hypothetical protein
LFPQTDTELLRWSGGIRNDRLIDLTPHPNYSTLVINERGWHKGQLSSDYVIQDGDEGSVVKLSWKHPKCKEMASFYQLWKEFRQAFADAGYRQFELIPIPNRYWGDGTFGPWFRVETGFGTIVIGWRKRVISIDWSETTLQLDPDFSTENVTKGDHSIHAWSYDAAIQYLRVIRGAAAGERIPADKTVPATPAL